MGITATTGQLADNHDVLSLHTFNDLEIHPEADDLVVTPKFGACGYVDMRMYMDRSRDGRSHQPTYHLPTYRIHTK